MRDDWFAVEELLTEEEVAVRDRVRDWAEREVRPVINDYWERGEYPDALVRGLAELGVVGGTVEGYGCPGLSPLASHLVTAELARVDGSVATSHDVHTSLAMQSIATLGDEEQKRRWLPRMASMELLGAFALTEPEHGSDVVNLETRARRDGEEVVLSGAKKWIGHGTVADVVVVWARDDDGAVGGYVVDHSDGPVNGFHATEITGKVGLRAIWQADIELDDVRIPAGNRLADADSFADTSRVLTASRASVAWEALGYAEAAYDLTLAYVDEREQFGQPIASFQLVQDKISAMLADLTGLRLLCVRLAQREAAGALTLEMAALAKMQAARAARRMLADAREVFGGNGLLLERHVARHFADVEAIFTYEGADAVQSLIVGRAVTGVAAFT